MTEITASDLLGLGLAPRTAYRYGRILLQVDQLLGRQGVDLMTARPSDVAQLCLAWPASHSCRCQLRGALIHAWEILGRETPPLRAVRVPPKPRARCKALSAEQAAAIERRAWERADDPGLAVLIGLYAGLRRAEIAGMAWEHLQFSAGRPVWLRVTGKGDVVADVPVHPQLARALLARAPKSKLGWLFLGKRGHVCPATIWDWVRDVGADAGVPELRPHVLRHTALAEAHDRSCDLRAVQNFARHAKPETTVTYTRTTAARLVEVVGMIDYGRRSA
jgi:integrase